MKKPRFTINWTKTMAWVIIILMSVSIIGFVGGSFFTLAPTGAAITEEYNGHTLELYNRLWRVSVNGQNYDFRYNPKDLEDVLLPLGTREWASIPKMYIIEVPNSEFTYVTQRNFLGAVLQSLNIKPQQACIAELGCGDYPIIDCDEQRGIIMMKDRERAALIEGQCLLFTAPTEEDLNMLTERLIYEFLGVMGSE